MSEKVTFSIGEISIPISPDEQWGNLVSESNEEQGYSLICDIFWMIQMTVIDRLSNEKEEFFKYFSVESAAKERERAVMGLKLHNNQGSIRLLNDAIEFNNNRNSGKFRELGEDDMLTSALILAMKFSELVARRDHAEFRRLADLIKKSSQNMRQVEIEKGGKYSLKGQIIKAFCDISLLKRDLPTKSEIRESLGIRYNEADRTEYKKFNESLNELGLKGLPSKKSI